MRFGTPSYLYALALIPPLIAFLIWGARQRDKALRRFVEANLAKRLVTEISPARRKWKSALLVGASALTLFSLARPQWGYRWEEVTRRGVDIMIAVDVSKSMLAGDVSPNRLERAKHKIEDLLNLLQGDRVGLIAFSGRAFVMTPLTLDYGAIRLFFDSLSPDLITAQGTNVGEAVDLAMRALKKGAPESQSLLLMTDGEDLSGDALEASKKAADQGVRIYALGIGTEAGAPIPVSGGGFKKDGSGQIVLTRLDESVLGKMASTTGGVYVRSVADDRDLQTLYAAMRGKLAEKDLKAGKQRHYIDRYQWFLALALLLLIAEALMADTKTGRFFRRRSAAIVLIASFLAPFGLRSASAFNLPGTVQEGERLYQAGKYEDALQKFLSAEIDHPGDPRIQYNLGNTYYQLKRYEDAQKLFDAAAKSPPKNAGLQEQSLYNRGNSQFRADRLEDAIASYEDALKIDPKDEDARYNLELAKKKLEQKKQQQQQQQNHDENQNKDQKKDQDQNKEQGQQDQKQNQSQQQNQSQSDQQEQPDQPSQKQPKSDQQPQSGEQENGDQNKEENQQKKEEGQKSPSQDQAGENRQPADGQMTRDEAARWLSTLQEGRRKIIPKGGKSKSESRGKDW